MSERNFPSVIRVHYQDVKVPELGHRIQITHGFDPKMIQVIEGIIQKREMIIRADQCEEQIARVVLHISDRAYLILGVGDHYTGPTWTYNEWPVLPTSVLNLIVKKAVKVRIVS